MRLLVGIHGLAALAIVGIGGARVLGADVGKPPLTPTYLEQGWSPSEREAFYYTPQGSQLIPYDWFLVLEKKEGGGLFRDNANLDRLRLLPREASPRNPDGLPVGFVKDIDDDPSRSAAKLSFLEKGFGKRTRTSEKSWLGMTCAACHTGRLEIGEATLQIDGAPSMSDFQTFLVELAEALEATHLDDPKIQRLAKALNQEPDELRKEVASHAQALTALVKRNHSTHPYGFARLDAFGSILNAICDAALGIPENRAEPNAPVSYPFLWDTPEMDWVQWNASANIPLARNVGEVLGAFGYFSLKTEGNRQQFDSTVRLRSLIDLENQVKKLKAPTWLEEILGRLDRPKARKGRELFKQACVACHQVRDAEGKFETIDMAGEPRIKTHAVAFQDIKTDPQMILNLGITADPGLLKPLLPAPLASLPRVPRGALLGIAVRGVTARRASVEGIPLTPNPAAGLSAPHGGAGYASRSLDGIWATAPYLHNGSVPSLYQLLLPSTKRIKKFFVGNRQFDSKNVGFQTEETPGAFAFQVANERGPILGNSNSGHEGHGGSDRQGYTEIFENGAWREFSDDERYALVEYLKALGHPTALTEDPVNTALEAVPEGEAAQIDHIVALTFQQLKNRYPGQSQVLRGVHAKDHGCVKATFEVLPGLDPAFRVGVFAEPGRKYDSWIRFSNAATLVLPDDPKGKDGKTAPGSRGMAIKLMGVQGEPLLPPHGAITQDFLLVNQPVFAFANVEDYEVLSEITADPANQEDASKFFTIQIGKGGAARDRALRTLAIVNRIRAESVAAGAFQPPPASPVDSRYFSGSPFRFGDGYVMKFSAVPVDPPADPKPNAPDPNYLRNALIERLSVREGAASVVFEFRVQRREVSGLNPVTDIEDASVEWPEDKYPSVTVAKITIPPQDFDSPERRALCEALFFSPWHGLTSHRPLGGINRMRLAVYEASSNFRHQPKEPESRERR